MSVIKKQHFVPQFYLRRFSNHDNQLFVFDKPNMRSFVANVRDVANEKYFYDKDNDIISATEKVITEQSDELLNDVLEIARNNGKKDQVIELFNKIPFSKFLEIHLNNARDPQFVESKMLAPYDEYLSNLLDEVLHSIHKKKKINREHRRELCFAIAVQHVRTRKYRDWLIEMREHFTNMMIEKGLYGEELKDYRVKLNKEVESRDHIASLENISFLNTLSDVFNNHIWRIGINKGTQPLYTSDAPIVMRSHINNPIKGVGFASPGTEINFPLTPRVILILCHRETFKKWEKLDCRTMNLNDENITYYNSLQIAQSQRQIYSATPNFDLAIEMCNRNPSLRDIKRAKIVVE